MNTRLGFALTAACLIAGCTKTYRPADGSAPPLAVHPVVTKPSPGAREFLADSTASVGIDFPDGSVLYYFPDRQLTGVRVESASPEPTAATNKVHVRLAAADRDRLRAFAAAHPEAAYLGLRFEATPAGSEPGGGITRGAVIVQVFKLSDLTDDGRLTFTRPTSTDADGLARRLVGR
jgi:hypothetical protein